MTDLTKLSAAKLEALAAKRVTLSSAVTRKLIDAGYGNERCSETYKRAQETGDALALEFVKATDAQCEVTREMEDRKHYHGTLRPIKRMTWQTYARRPIGVKTVN